MATNISIDTVRTLLVIVYAALSKPLSKPFRRPDITKPPNPKAPKHTATQNLNIIYDKNLTRGMTLRRNPATGWLESYQPEVGDGTFVDPAAVVIGKVEVGKNCYIGPTAVLRGDEGEIRIGNACNIQDGVIIHALKGSSVDVHDDVSLAHGCVIHGPAEIGSNSFVGFRSVILRARIGENCFIGHGCIIIGVEIPDGKLVEDGMIIKNQKDVEKLSDVGEEQKEFVREVREVNLEFARAYSSLHSR